MRRQKGRGFFLGLGFIMLWQSGWAAFALVVWLLHRWRGVSLFLCWAALGIWLLSALIATILIYANTARADAPVPAPENQNPYSADNAQVFLGVADGPAGRPASGEPTRTAVLVVWRSSVAQGLAQRLRDTPSLRLLFEPSHTRAEAAVRSGGADVALVEVAESGGHGIADCLALCDRLREEAPQCKLLLMCPEQDRAGVAQAIEAKSQSRIDDFVFYDATTEYLVSKLLSM